MKVLVAGGAGFIGSHLCERLVADGHVVYSMDDYSGGTKDNHVHGVVYVAKHTTEINKMVNIEQNFDVVFHLGEFARIVPSFENIKEVWRSNIEGTFEVIKFCQERKIKLVYAASSTKFAPEGVTHSPYSFTKETNTRLIPSFDKWYGLRYAICYFYNVYGKRDDTGSRGTPTLIGNFIKKYNNGEPLPIYGHGEHRRIYTHVSDVVDGLIKAWHYKENDEFFLSANKAYSVNQVANMFKGAEIKYHEPRPGDRADVSDDSAETRKKLNWETKIELKDYIRENTI